MKIIVFAAHCDDESIGLGGTIYKHTQRGDQVKLVVMTYGRGGGLGVDPEDLARVRERETREACEVLGILDIEFLRFKEQYLFLTEETFGIVSRIIRSFKPDRIYVHHGDASLNQDNLDHTNTYAIVSRAVFTVKWPQSPELGPEAWDVRDVYTYEVISPLHNPTSYVDISDVVDKKIEAMSQYKSQMKWGRWNDAILGLNRFRGLVNRVGEYAEAFTAVKTAIL